MVKELARRKMSKVVSKLDSFIFSLSLLHLPKANLMEDKFIEELRNEVSEAADIDYETDSKFDISWTTRLRELIMKDDPRKFLSWDVIRKIMFIGHALYIRKELKYLKERADWDHKWGEIIGEIKREFPVKYMRYIKGVNNNTIHQVYHLAKFEEFTSVSIKEIDLIIEFGGGYGNICHLIHNLGFNGRYIIYDLPIVSSLQRYYLRSNSIKVIRNLEEFRNSNSGVYCVSELDILSKMNSNSTKTLFIATWSISEVDMDLRNKFLSVPLIDKCKNYLIAYGDKFGGIDNLRFFKDWSSNKKDIVWANFKIPHLLAENYTFGCQAKEIPAFGGKLMEQDSRR